MYDKAERTKRCLGGSKEKDYITLSISFFPIQLLGPVKRLCFQIVVAIAFGEQDVDDIQISVTIKGLSLDDF